MKPENAEDTSTKNAKISDSGCSNTFSNDQSHASSGSSLSENSNRSIRSSGYHGGNPSICRSLTETLPKPITKRKDKSHKKKSKSNGLTSSGQLQNLEAGLPQTGTLVNYTKVDTPVGLQTNIVDVDCELPASGCCKPSLLDKSTEEVATIELVDATDPGVHNDNNLATTAEAELSTKTNAIDESTYQSSEEYYAVISMHDGVVLHATPSLHTSLGYPKDSWTGKLFMDLLDSKDKDVIAERIAHEIAVYRDYRESSDSITRKKSIFCRLRKNTTVVGGLSKQKDSNDASSSRSIPHRVNLVIQNFHDDKSSTFNSQIMLLVASFQPVYSAYKAAEDIIMSTVFTTRHTASCRLSYVDPDIVQYTGYLPQDMIDRSLFDFYYFEDLSLIKDIYETVINLDNNSYRSKPYRFIVQNGDFIVLETKWSSFINPWTKTLEFVIGQHRVLRGPTDPNVFRSPVIRQSDCLVGNKVLEEAEIIQKEIVKLLAQRVQRESSSCAVTDCHLLAKKCELTSFVENILQEIRSPAPIKDSIAVDGSFSGCRNPVLQAHASVMLGEISPHHEYPDSKSSTETPPSYNQLNYHDKIERFFKSNIGMSVNNKPYASEEDNVHSSANSSEELGKTNGNFSTTAGLELKRTSSTNRSGKSGSAENLSGSGGSNNKHQSLGSQDKTSNTTSNFTQPEANRNAGAAGHTRPPGLANADQRVKPAILTESLLNQHNKDMEKLMMQLHREQKKGDKRNKSSLNEQKAKQQQQQNERPAVAVTSAARGEQSACKSATAACLKRSASQSWEAQGHDKHKLSKLAPVQQKAPSRLTSMINGSMLVKQNGIATTAVATAAVAAAAAAAGLLTPTNPNVGLWKPVSATIPTATTMITQQQYIAPASACTQAMGQFSMFPQFLPLYYVPVPQLRDNPPSTVLSQEQRSSGPSNSIGQPAPYCFVPVPYMATTVSSVMYPPIIGSQPIYRPFIVPEAVPTASANGTQVNQTPASGCPTATSLLVTSSNAVSPTSFDLERPVSRETSVKAEPSSTMAMSESSKKIFSSCGIISSCVLSNEDGSFSITDECTTAYTKNNSLSEDKANGSRISSSFGSTLSKSYDSSSNTDQRNTTYSVEGKEGRRQVNRKSFGMIRKEPPWIEGVKITPELIYQYQMESKAHGDVLKADFDFLRHSKQPSLVNEQLEQLFLHLDLEGFDSKLILEETYTNSPSDSSSDTSYDPSRMGAW